MADITRRTAKILIDQMLTKYQQAMEACIDDKSGLSAEALKIVNDYESNDIGKVIDKILYTEDYFPIMKQLICIIFLTIFGHC